MKHMKKYVFISLMALVTMVFTGCQKNEPCQFNKKTIDLLVSTNDWKFDDVSHQFYVHYTLNEITSDLYTYGSFTLYREMVDDFNKPYLVALPMSLYLQDPGSGDFYTQHIDYRVGVGYVEIQLTNSDWAYDTDEQGSFVSPGSMVFRMQIVY